MPPPEPKPPKWTFKEKTLKSKGRIDQLPHRVKVFVEHWTRICQPGSVYICDGSVKELDDIVKPWATAKIVHRLGPKRQGILFQTNPKDAGKAFHSKTFFVDMKKEEAVTPTDEKGVFKDFTLDQWRGLEQKFMSSMQGRRMYVIPFQLGQAKRCQFGVLITDCPYVYVAMVMEVRVSASVLESLADAFHMGAFIKWVHSMGCPRPSVELVRDHWPCDPSEAFLAYHPNDMRIKTYGGSAFNPTSCLLPLVLDSTLCRLGGRMVSRFSILSIKTPHGAEFFVAMATADGCDVTINMAESVPSLAGYEIKIVAMNRMTYLWLDEELMVRAGNPVIGFSGVGNSEVNHDKSPALLRALRYSSSLFLNTAMKDKQEFLWEGMEKTISKNDAITDWRGLPWCPEEDDGPKHGGCGGGGGGNSKSGNGGDGRDGADGSGDRRQQVSHPDCRFYCFYSKYSCVHPRWADPHGFPISAIIFGGERPKEVPLVYECKSWLGGSLTGACVKTETSDGDRDTTRDPMAMDGLLQNGRLGKYLKRWLHWDTYSSKMPRVFHVNWWKSRKNPQSGENIAGHETWPGGADNVRVLDWILRRCDDQENIALTTPIGYIPRVGSINMSGLENIDIQPLLVVGKAYWLEELARDKEFLESQTEPAVPPYLLDALRKQEEALTIATDADLGLIPKHCSGPVIDKCYTCLGPTFNSRLCKCKK